MRSSDEQVTASRELLAPALPRSLDDVQDLVHRLWTDEGQVGLTDRIRFECAVAEIAANVIEHSEPGDGRTMVTITVSVSCSRELLRAVFIDNGQPIVVDLEAGMPNAEAVTGRGLAIARAASDVLGYERAGTRNIWTVECLRGS